MEKVRLALCDDHPVVLAGLRNLVAAHTQFELIGTASTGIAGLQLITEKQPDIAVLDISLPGMNGIALARRLAQDAPSVRVIVLTLHEDRAFLKQALEAGARAYVLKRSAAENLLDAIEAVLAGDRYVDPALRGALDDRGAPRGTKKTGVPNFSDLTERETEVLRLTALGHTSKETARRLDVGVKSVETYKARGMEKLGLKTRADLVRFAAAEGWMADV